MTRNYLIVETPAPDCLLTSIVFEPLLNHDAITLPACYKIVGAGEVEIKAERGEGGHCGDREPTIEINCSGRSDTLNIESNPARDESVLHGWNGKLPAGTPDWIKDMV